MSSAWSRIHDKRPASLAPRQPVDRMGQVAGGSGLFGSLARVAGRAVELGDSAVGVDVAARVVPPRRHLGGAAEQLAFLEFGWSTWCRGRDP